MVSASPSSLHVWLKPPPHLTVSSWDLLTVDPEEEWRPGLCRACIIPELAHPFLLRVWGVVLTAGIAVVLAPAVISTNDYKEWKKVYANQYIYDTETQSKRHIYIRQGSDTLMSVFPLFRNYEINSYQLCVTCHYLCQRYFLIRVTDKLGQSLKPYIECKFRLTHFW